MEGCSFWQDGPPSTEGTVTRGGALGLCFGAVVMAAALPRPPSTSALDLPVSKVPHHDMTAPTEPETILLVVWRKREQRCREKGEPVASLELLDPAQPEVHTGLCSRRSQSTALLASASLHEQQLLQTKGKKSNYTCNEVENLFIHSIPLGGMLLSQALGLEGKSLRELVGSGGEVLLEEKKKPSDVLLTSPRESCL